MHTINPQDYGFSSIGENIWAWSAIGVKTIPDDPIQDWYNEKDYYDYNSNWCRQEPCGHYTTVSSRACEPSVSGRFAAHARLKPIFVTPAISTPRPPAPRSIRSRSSVFWNVCSPLRSHSPRFLPAPLHFLSAQRSHALVAGIGPIMPLRRNLKPVRKIGVLRT